MNGQVFGRATVAEALGQEHLDAADLADLLHAREIGFARAQRTLRLDPVVDIGVGADPTHHLADIVANRHGAGEVPAVDAVLAAQAKLDLVHRAARQGLLPGLDREADVFGVHDLAPAIAPQRLQACAGVLDHLVIEPIELAIRSCRPDVVRHGGGEGAELRLAGTQRLFGDHALGRLHDDREYARRLAALVEQGAVIEVDPDVGRPARTVEDQVLVAE